MIKVEGREVILNEALIIPYGETASVTVSVRGVQLTIFIRFEHNPATRETIHLVRPTTRWKLEGNRVDITFENWNNASGTMMRKPKLLGNFGGELFGFTVVQYTNGPVDFVQFQFLVGGSGYES